MSATSSDGFGNIEEEAVEILQEEIVEPTGVGADTNADPGVAVAS